MARSPAVYILIRVSPQPRVNVRECLRPFDIVSNFCTLAFLTPTILVHNKKPSSKVDRHVCKVDGVSSGGAGASGEASEAGV